MKILQIRQREKPKNAFSTIAASAFKEAIPPHTPWPVIGHAVALVNTHWVHGDQFKHWYVRMKNAQRRWRDAGLKEIAA